ncbi:hypothetical protein QAD02_003971 [Eretmocerus hayati]|uniref:Uncharacterized protein n=1 Tax=Eretmocerus hayati TaxID=131215 RepID=A0ACC2NNJ9_9HYME|nr:hypothetical protein QAD02_003971 [Eretmocerus hayati]
MAPVDKRHTLEKGAPGRPKHEVWSLGFRRVVKQCEKTQRTIHAAFCVICSKVLCNTASKRLSAHRRVCSFEPNNDAEILIKHQSTADTELAKGEIVSRIVSADDATTTITFVDDIDESQFENSVDPIVNKTEYTFVDSGETFEHFKATCVTGNDAKLDMAFTQFFIGCNIPFSVADSPYFKKLCTFLNPACRLISSEQLSGPLLDTMHLKFHKDVKVGPTSVLLIDGWKNEATNSKNVTAMLRTEANETIFLDNHELSNSKDIVKDLTDIVQASIADVSERYSTEVFAVIMGNSCSLIKMEDIDGVWLFSCNAYILKLFIKDYIPSDFMNTLCKLLRQLNTVFRDEDLENKISGDMRWTNIKCILEYCITNLAMIQTVLSSENLIKLTQEQKVLFFSEEFIQKIESYIAFLDSISEMSTVCQMPKANIADTTEQWLSLSLPAEDLELGNKLSMRQASVLKVQSLVANYLHPAYRGKRLTDDQMNGVEEFLLTELNSDGLNSLQSYVNGESIFKVLNQKAGLNASTYWSLARRTHSDLATLALKLISIPASINTNFSQTFNTMTNTSLKADQLRKLFAVYYHLKETEEKSEIE